MSIGSALGAVGPLAQALGLLGPDGQIDTGFFSNPVEQMSGTLRDPDRLRDLLTFVEQVLGQDAEPISIGNATWTPLLTLSDSVSLFIVVAPSVAPSGGNVLGLGIQATTTGTPGGQGTLSIPLVLVPPTQPVSFLPGSSEADALASLIFAVDVDSQSFDSASINLQIPLGNAQSPGINLDVKGLVLPGASSPIDISIGGSSAASIGTEMVQAIASLIDAELAAAANSFTPEAVALLGLVGLDPGAPEPFPLAEVATGGMASLQTWLTKLCASPPALEGIVASAAKLAGGTPASGSESPAATWTLSDGVTLSISLLTASDSAGGTSLAMTAAVVAALGGTPTASLELSATLFQANVGPTPSAEALPALSCTACYSGSPLFNATSAGTNLEVGRLRIGVSLDSARRVVFVLGADDVYIGPPGATDHYATIDLTSPNALASIGGEALSAAASNLLSGLGLPAALGVFVGISPPESSPADWPQLNLASFLSNPLDAVVGYHTAVLALGASSYALLLQSLSSLFGSTGAIPGSGTAADPWLPVVRGPVALAIWADRTTPPALHIGGRWAPPPAAVGSKGPELALELIVDTLAVKLGSSFAATVLPNASLVGSLSTPAGSSALSIPVPGGTIDVEGAALSATWAPGGTLQVTFVPQGSVAVEGSTTAFTSLPEVAGGSLSFPSAMGAQVVESLLAAALTTSDSAWLRTVANALGLGQVPTGASVPSPLADPVSWLATRLGALIATDADGAFTNIATTLSALAAGPADAVPSATGSPDDPVTIGLGASGATSLGLSVWLDPGGPPPAPSKVSGLLSPPTLTAALSGGAPVTTAQLAEFLEAAALVVPTMADLLAGREEVSAGWDALIARCAGGDGLLPGGAPDIAGSSAHTVANVPNWLLPAALELSTLALPSAQVTLYVTGPYAPPSWPDASVTTIDLTAPGLAAAAFDVSAASDANIAALHVRLPSRADCPGTDAATLAQAQADRLGQVVQATQAPGARRVLIVAHGSAGGAAQMVATTGSPVVGVALLGVPATPVPLDVLDAPPAADALALLQALLPAPAAAGREPPALTTARAVLGLFAELYETSSDPNADLAPPPGLGAPAVPTVSVRGALDAPTLTLALAAVVGAGLASFAGNPAPAAPTALRTGLTAAATLGGSSSTANPSGLSIDVSVRLEGPGLALPVGTAPAGPAPPAAARVDVEIYRAGGWLSGGPQGSAPAPVVSRIPALRRARLTVTLGLEAPGRSAAVLTLVEGSALGVTQPLWTLGATNLPSPPARILLGRLAGALGPLPSTGPVAALAGLLTAVGLADPSTPAPGFALSVDALQRLLADPSGQLSAALSASGATQALASALASLLGDTTTSAGQVSFSAGGLTISADLASSPPSLHLALPAPVALGGGPVVSGSIELSGATWSGSITVAPPTSTSLLGGPSLQLRAGPGGRSVALCFADGAGAIPSRVLLFPAAGGGDIPGAAEVVVETVAATALKALIGGLRAEAPVEALEMIDPALHLLGLVSGSAGSFKPATPFGILGDTAGYLRQVLGSGSALDPAAVVELFTTARGALGLGTADLGVLPIGGTVTLSAAPAPSGGLQLTLGAGTGPPSLQVGVGLTIGAGAPVPTFQGTFGLKTGAASLSVGLSGSQLNAVLHTSSADIPLLPNCPGLGSLAAAAGNEALPFVLSTLESSGLDLLPAALGAVRSVLGLGAASFDASQLRLLASDPPTELARRLAAAGPDALGQLSKVLPALPAPWAVVDTNGLLISCGTQTVQLTFGGSPPSLLLKTTLEFSVPTPPIDVSIDATVDTGGLQLLNATAALDPTHAIGVGPLDLAPCLRVSTGSDASPSEVALGLGFDTAMGPRTALLALQLGNGVTPSLQTMTGTTVDASADPLLLVTELLVPAAADLALAQSQVGALLKTPVGSSTILGVLQGVVLTSSATPTFDTAALALASLPGRLATLGVNLSNASLSATIADNLTVSMASSGGQYGIRITLTAGQRAEVVRGSPALGIEVADSWVLAPQFPPGLSLYFLSPSSPVAPTIIVEGLGLRIYDDSGPLIDSAVQIGSIAIYTLLRVSTVSGVPAITDGGVAIQLADLGVPLASASGSSNPVAQGILGDTQQSGGSNGTPLRPSFSPQLSLQQRASTPGLQWGLVAGPGNGPWTIPIDRSFGPVRVDDVGFQSSPTGGAQITTIGMLLSGGLSLAGLSLDLDNLSVNAPWPASASQQSIVDPGAWSIDLSGLDVAYSGGGVSLVGGLRKRNNSGSPPDYVGILVANVGPYGLTAFGGYGQFPSPSGTFTSLFVFAAVDAPIGGPPVFFVTGLAGGAGLNRALVLPTNLNDFSTFPLVAALDTQSGLASDPSQAMDLLSTSFPPQQGTFWFAAGLSFTSFALVDVVAVLAIEVGNGFAVTLLGLATAALPTPYLPLAQIQLALMANFSTADGVLEVLAQLTDQSYLLDPSCRLTGGFAYVSWFGSNPNAGQFVLTLGGYDKSFHHDGYPVVPPVGFVWSILSVLTISGQTYFALCSEAIMAGTSFTAALTLGPLWASLSLGVDAIVYFDPFKFHAEAYASIGAGITISVDLLFGTVTINLSFHLGADVVVQGPSINGSATIDLDVTSATIAFGSTQDSSTTYLPWGTSAGVTGFVDKYLGGSGSVLSAAQLSGVITPGGSGPAPDGSPGNPWLFLPEFSLSVTTTAAATQASLSTSASEVFPPAPGSPSITAYPVSGTVAIAPMNIAAIDSCLGITISPNPDDGSLAMPTFTFAPSPVPFLSATLTSSPLPKGIWAPQLPTGQIPTGDTIAAGTGMVVTGQSDTSPGTQPIQYNQIDVNPSDRLILPFAVEKAARPDVLPDARNAATFFASEPTDSTTALCEAFKYLTSGPKGAALDPYTSLTFSRNRVAPPRLALLTEGLAPTDPPAPQLSPVPVGMRPTIDLSIQAPVLTALLGGGPASVIRPVLRTTAPLTSPAVAGSSAAAPPSAPAPTLAGVAASIDPAFGARLLKSAAPPQSMGTGLVAGDGGAATGRAGTPVEFLTGPGNDPDTAAVLQAQATALLGAGALLRPGELLVMTLPNQERDVDRTAARPALAVAGNAAVRVVALSATGEVLTDTTVSTGSVSVPQYTARLVAWCVGGDGSTPAGLAGWSATNRLPYVGIGVHLAAEAVVTGLIAPRRGFQLAQAAWASVAAPAAQARMVTTWLPDDTTAVVVSVDAAANADLAQFSVGLSGASRAAALAGSAPPLLVAAGGRAHLVYDVVPAGGEPVAVSVGTGSSWRLAGVLGGIGDAATTAARVAAVGTGTIAAPLLVSPLGTATVRWVAPAAPPASPPLESTSSPPGGAS